MASISFTGNSVVDAVKFVDLDRTGRSTPDLKARFGKSSALSSVADRLQNFQGLVRELSDKTSFSGAKASSSATSVATVSASSGASLGEFSLEVTKLAKRQITTSTTGYANTSDTVADGGSISFSVNGGTTTTINVTSATSLSDLKDQINNQNSGVVASITNDAVSNKLVLSSRETGQGEAFTVNNSLTNSGGTALAFAAGQSSIAGNTQNAQNAAFKVDGKQFNSTSNTVLKAVAGTSITLVGKGTTTISVSSDPGSVGRSVRRFVDEFNSLEQDYSRLSSDPSKRDSRDRIAASSELRDTIREVRRALSSTVSGTYKKLSDIGISSSASGRLTLDQSKLDKALSASLRDVEGLLRGRGGKDGIFSELRARLKRNGGATGFVVPPRDGVRAASSNLRQKQQYLGRSENIVKRAVSGLNKSNALSSVLIDRESLWFSQAQKTNRPRSSRRCSCGTMSLGSSARVL